MSVYRNIELTGAAGRTFFLDIYTAERKAPVVVFTHGFKGFKDWGAWDLVARKFAASGYNFIKYNLSHNGIVQAGSTELEDLEAFGQNNYSKELFDLKAVIDFAEAQVKRPVGRTFDLSSLVLIGHSRGGGLSILQAARDERVSALITWASVSRMDYAWLEPGFVERWKEEGVYYVENSRTKQRMPLYFQFYEDFEANREDYSTELAMQSMKCPVLIAHGSSDPAVSHQQAEQLHRWNTGSSLYLLPEADHVFGMHHPYDEKQLPRDTQLLVQQSINWLGEL